MNLGYLGRLSARLIEHSALVLLASHSLQVLTTSQTYDCQDAFISIDAAARLTLQ